MIVSLETAKIEQGLHKLNNYSGKPMRIEDDGAGELTVLPKKGKNVLQGGSAAISNRVLNKFYMKLKPFENGI
jgi:hypothetical protein